ncbi:MAG: Fpg/Nei family DNA glycosylase [Propionibacteriales bacterium]|nr:Fpg/Nei family DNA glycosylase [Propionibacteriales bacterium]
MPEGHTLHRLANDLNAAFADHVVAVSSPQGRFVEGAALVDGQLWHGAQAHGKHLFCAFAGEMWVHIHLGLIGSLRFGPPGPPVGQVRLRLATDDVVADLRGPQFCALITDDERRLLESRLGPDPLDPAADPEPARRRISRSSRSIGALLMDQTVLAGVGNVYRAEVLFRQRINPETPGRKLKPSSWRAIWADLVDLMPYGVADNRIDTVRPEHTPEEMGRPPRVDDHGGEVYVYRRDQQPCHVCGAMIRTKIVEGRNLFWCGRCQRRS